MSYADLPATRAMQPLTFEEYLPTDKPTVVRSLPATTNWADAADVCDSAEAFTVAVKRRCEGGLTAEHGEARGAVNGGKLGRYGGDVCPVGRRGEVRMKVEDPPFRPPSGVYGEVEVGAVSGRIVTRSLPAL